MESSQIQHLPTFEDPELSISPYSTREALVFLDLLMKINKDSVGGLFLAVVPVAVLENWERETWCNAKPAYQAKVLQRTRKKHRNLRSFVVQTCLCGFVRSNFQMFIIVHRWQTFPRS